MSNLAVVDIKTGEIVQEFGECSYIGSTKRDLEIKNIIERQQRENYRRSEQPNFVFSMYDTCMPYMESKDLDSSDISRIILLATYCNYKSILMKTQKTKMSKDDMMVILRLSNKTRFTKFYNKILQLGFIEENEDSIKMNKTMFVKGVVRKKENVCLTRLYIDEVRHIFNKVSTRSLKKLGYIYQLLPYIHFDSNKICKNPDESILENIEELTTGEFADIIGINKKGIHRLLNDLLSIETTDGESFLGMFFTKSLLNGTIYVNPKVMYSGKYESENRIDTEKLFIEDRIKRGKVTHSGKK